jgi:hypothetical protein
VINSSQNKDENSSKCNNDDDNYQLAFWRLSSICKLAAVIFMDRFLDGLQGMQLMGAENQSVVSGGVSTQVLDLVRGVPVSRMAVTLWLECGNSWTQISEG